MTLPRPAFLACAGADAMFSALQTKIVAPAARGGLPAIYNLREFASDRDRMSHGPSIRDAYAGAATSADRVLEGANPADIPAVQPVRSARVINVATIRSLGAPVPQELLPRVDTVIQ